MPHFKVCPSFNVTNLVYPNIHLAYLGITL